MTDQSKQLRASFIGASLPVELVDVLLEEYAENKRRDFLSDYSPVAINGGRFCEVVVRVLQFLETQSYTALTDSIKVESVLNQAENYMSLDDGLRVHVTRAIRTIYGVRNSRNTGHLRGGINPNFQDSTLVVRTMDWILSELVRVAHDVSSDIATQMIANIVSREVPLVEEINGRPVILGDLPRADLILVLLYWAGGSAVPGRKLREWLPEKVRKYSSGILKGLEADRKIYISDGLVYLTRLGVRHVESGDLLRSV